MYILSQVLGVAGIISMLASIAFDTRKNYQLLKCWQLFFWTSIFYFKSHSCSDYAYNFIYKVYCIFTLKKV